MIAREGVLPTVVAMLLAGAALGADAHVGAISGIILALLIVSAFRDRARSIPSAPLALLSPVDGRFVDGSLRRDPWLARESLRLSMRMSVLGMGIIRSPIEGQVREFWVRGGIADDGDLERASSPTSYAIWIQTDEEDDVVVAVFGLRHISRFKLDVAPGERIGHGHRLGFVYFGTAVTVYAPAFSTLSDEAAARFGRSMLGGEHVLASLSSATVDDNEDLATA
jgi:phosphatidylserine decarboxylase